MGSTRDELVNAGKEQLESAKEAVTDAAQKTRDELKATADKVSDDVKAGTASVAAKRPA